VTDCRNCGRPITTVTLAGVTVWSHDTDELPPQYAANTGPRFCHDGTRNMATPKETK
jgi:hypothetical protein